MKPQAKWVETRYSRLYSRLIFIATWLALADIFLALGQYEYTANQDKINEINAANAATVKAANDQEALVEHGINAVIEKATGSYAEYTSYISANDPTARMTAAQLTELAWNRKLEYMPLSVSEKANTLAETAIAWQSVCIEAVTKYNAQVDSLPEFVHHAYYSTTQCTGG